MSQNEIDLSQDYTGIELLDNVLAQDRENYRTNNSGVSRPSYAVEGTMWLDKTSTPWKLKMFNGTDDIIMGDLNPSTLKFKPTESFLELGTDQEFSDGTSTTKVASIKQIKDETNTKVDNPMTTTGDIIYQNSEGSPSRLPTGSLGYVLTSNGPGLPPSYQEGSNFLKTNISLYQNAGENLEEVSEGIYKVPTGSSFTLASGLSFSRDDEPQVSFLGLSDGDYYVFVPLEGAIVKKPTSSLSIQKEEPSSPSTGDVWFNPYSSPYTSKEYDGADWVDFPYVLANTVITVDSSATPVVSFPLMTGENAPSGQFASYTSNTSATGTYIYNYFDGDEGTGSSISNESGSAYPVQIDRYDSNTPHTFNGIYLKGPATLTQYSADQFKFQVSTDGITYTDATPLLTGEQANIIAGHTYLLNDTYTAKYGRLVELQPANIGYPLNFSEIQMVLIQPYKITNIGNRTSYTESIKDQPSTRYDDVTLLASGTQYTAPADGWFTVQKISGQGNAFLVLQNDTKGMSNGHGVSSEATITPMSATIRCSKGDLVSLTWTGNGALNYFRFIYGKGEY